MMKYHATIEIELDYPSGESLNSMNKIMQKKLKECGIGYICTHSQSHRVYEKLEIEPGGLRETMRACGVRYPY